MFGYVANFIYDGDAPLAERRAQALSIDQARLRELLGDLDLREILDPDAVAEVERELQCLEERRRALSADGLRDLLLGLGDLSTAEDGPQARRWQSRSRRWCSRAALRLSRSLAKPGTSPPKMPRAIATPSEQQFRQASPRFFLSRVRQDSTCWTISRAAMLALMVPSPRARPYGALVSSQNRWRPR